MSGISHGFDSVVREIENDLLKLDRVGGHRQHRFGEIELDLHPMRMNAPLSSPVSLMRSSPARAAGSAVMDASRFLAAT